MALQTCLDTLTNRLRALADTVNDLRLTAVEDRPAGAEQMILDTVAGSVEELTGWVFEAHARASAAREALASKADTDTALRWLAACHERVNQLSGGVWGGPVSYETYSQLGRLAREHGGEWPSWLAMLRLGLESCGPPIHAVQAALLESWREAAPVRPVLADVNTQWRCSP
jgi:hypothetical protein